MSPDPPQRAPLVSNGDGTWRLTVGDQTMAVTTEEALALAWAILDLREQ